MVRRPPTSSHGAGLFAHTPPEPRTVPAAYIANIDGGSRGNPGPAAYGVVIRNSRGEIVANLKKYIGRTTNNVAEYYGLIAALDYAQSHGVRALRIESDSELLVKQMRGQYKVKSDDLRPLFERARKMSRSFEWFKIEHVFRERNREADALANEALDDTSRSPGSTVLVKPEARIGKPEARKIRARYRSGILYPLEDLDLPDGAEVEILLRALPKP